MIDEEKLYDEDDLTDKEKLYNNDIEEDGIRMMKK